MIETIQGKSFGWHENSSTKSWDDIGDNYPRDEDTKEGQQLLEKVFRRIICAENF